MSLLIEIGTLNATPPTPSPAPSPEPTISPYPASPVHSPAPSPDTVIISHQHQPRYLHILVHVHTAVLEFLQAPHQLLILTLLFLQLMHLMVPPCVTCTCSVQCSQSRKQGRCTRLDISITFPILVMSRLDRLARLGGRFSVQVRLEVMGKKAKNATNISGNEAGKISEEI
ncbi:unnamed protein product [Prunus armeniaca]|uniref:Uncharacterized protein n=1 Tax=Prunus armeniaca TaxID=36596 RepID=A0A6J5XUB3_PRUAR|nr:unnamed protein product [Prunus armeniaca]